MVILRTLQTRAFEGQDMREQEDGETEMKDEEEAKHNGNTLKLFDSSNEKKRAEPAYEFPEDLMEKIASRLPLSSLFKFGALSKRWHSKFSNPSESEHSPTSFQDEVVSASTRWPTFCPVFVAGKEILGYDRTGNNWHKISLHHSIPQPPGNIGFLGIAFGGSLLCLVGRFERGLRVLVANIITGRWSNLPYPPIMGQDPCNYNLIPVGSHGYKVLLLYAKCNIVNAEMGVSRKYEVVTQSLDSKFKTWTCKYSEVVSSVGTLSFLTSSSAYEDGNLYMCSYPDARFRWRQNNVEIWKYNVEDGVWTMEQLEVLEEVVNKLWTKSQLGEESFLGSGVILCSSKLLVVTLVQIRVASGIKTGARVYELVPETMQLVEVSKMPPKILRGGRPTTFLSHDGCIYFNCESYSPDPSPQISVYNTGDQQWSRLPPPPLAYDALWTGIKWVDSQFDPALNPFAPA